MISAISKIEDDHRKTPHEIVERLIINPDNTSSI